MQERAIEGRLFTTLAKVLNVGLLISALFHILEFGSLLVDGGIDVSGGRPGIKKEKEGGSESNPQL